MLVAALDTSLSNASVTEFLRAIEVERLPAAADLETWIRAVVVSAGTYAPDLATDLIRLVGRSKHEGPAARASYTRDSLIQSLIDDGVQRDVLLGMGVMRVTALAADSSWDRYRGAVVDNLRQFRIYGLSSAGNVFADLPTLFVALRLRHVRAERDGKAVRREQPRHVDFLEAMARESEDAVWNEDDHRERQPQSEGVWIWRTDPR